MPWAQRYDPLGSVPLSTALALLPIVVLLGLLASHRARAHHAALAGLLTALVVAVAGIGMPAGLAGRAALFGAAYGLFPVGWILVNVLALYRLTVERGHFAVVQGSIAGVTRDRRLQLVLVAFCFGAFFEGAAGFGTPVAVTVAILIGLGFPALDASVYSLIANTAPVAFGALGTPLIALQGVTGLDLRALSAMVGHQLPIFSVIVPFWLIAAFDGWRGVRETWPALLVAGVAFALPQHLVAVHHGPWLVDVVASVCSMAALTLFLRWWRPATRIDGDHGGEAAPLPDPARAALARAWAPWAILTVVVFIWGTPTMKAFLNGVSAPSLPVAGLHLAVLRVAPVVADPTPEGAIYVFNWLSATGSGILIATLLGALVMGCGLADVARAYTRTLRDLRLALLTIAAMMALGYITRYSGTDTILGLAFARTGLWYPFFGTLLGWLGVALTGSDTSSNVLFGGLQMVTAQQVGVDPTLMAAANSSGGVMGKMIDAQSIVVAGAATGQAGHEGTILRRVLWHSIALASLVGLWVLLQARLGIALP
jgi:lactate permease